MTSENEQVSERGDDQDDSPRHPRNFRDVAAALQQLASSSSSSSTGVAATTSVEFANAISSGALYRCGVIEGFSFEALGAPKTVVNLRAEPDLGFLLQQTHTLPADAAEHRAAAQQVTLFPPEAVAVDLARAHGTRFLHIATEERLERYDTSARDVRLWVIQFLKAVEDCALPLLVHCRAGRDRTGVCVAALLLACGVSPDVVVAEFSLSQDGRVDLFTSLTIPGFLGVPSAQQQQATNSRRGSPSKAGQHQRRNQQQALSPAEAMERYVRGQVDLEKVRRNLGSFVSQTPAAGAGAAAAAAAVNE